MTDAKTSVQELKNIFKTFVEERDWKQFHNPKNLAMNIGIEAGELQEIFVWEKEEDSWDVLEKHRKKVENEIADITFNLLNFCELCNIDVTKAVATKLKELGQRYDIDSCKGRRSKKLAEEDDL